MAEKTGAEVSVRLVVPKEIGRVLESDLCVIAGNLLENAVKPAAGWRGRRFIRMESRLQYGTLTIVMDNSDPGGTERQNGVFLSSKREGRRRPFFVAAVARRYGGAARFESAIGVFSFLGVYPAGRRGRSAERNGRGAACRPKQMKGTRPQTRRSGCSDCAPGEGRAWIPFLRGASFPVKEFIEGGFFAKNGIESLV